MQTALKKLLFIPVRDHLLRLFFQLDPVASEYAPRHAKSTFYIPLLVLITTFLYGNILMFYSEEACSGSNSLSLEALSQCPLLQIHQVFPRQIWAQVDVCYLIAFLSSLLIYSALLTSGSVNSRTRYNFHRQTPRSIDDAKLPISVSYGKQKLSRSTSVAILKYHRLFQQIFTVILVCMIIITGTLNFICLLFINAVYTVSLRDALLFLLLHPLHISYTQCIFTFMVSFVLMDTTFLSIRQRALLKQFTRLQLSIATRTRAQQKADPSLGSTWQQYLALNRSLASLCVDIEHISGHWSTTLTLYMATLITIVTYLVYITFFASGNLTLVGRVFFIYVTVCLVAFLFLLVHFTAKVAQLSGALERVNGKFCMAFLRRGGFRLHSVRHCLKADWLQSHRRLRPYCMVLLDNYRLTSKTFYFVISYTVTIFLAVFKNNNNSYALIP